MESSDRELMRAFCHRPCLLPPVVPLELELKPGGAFLETTDVRERVQRLDCRDKSQGSLFLKEGLEPDIPG
jgi:hypothetical protein